MTSCYTAWSALHASTSHPSISETENSVAIPPNHTLITSLDIMSCGGKAIIPPYLVLPTSLSGGYYVLEVQDMTDERCRQRLDGKPSSGAGDEYANMYSIVPPSHSSKSLFKISVT